MKLTDEFLIGLKDIYVKIYKVPEDNPYKYSIWPYPPGEYKLFHHHCIFQEETTLVNDCLFEILKNPEGKYYFQIGNFDWDIESSEIETVEDFKTEIIKLIEIKEYNKRRLTERQDYLRQYL